MNAIDLASCSFFEHALFAQRKLLLDRRFHEGPCGVLVMEELRGIEKKINFILEPDHMLDQVSSGVFAQSRDRFHGCGRYRGNADHLIGEDSKWTGVAMEHDN